jgi:mono/diheme cytochrome c family protein
VGSSKIVQKILWAVGAFVTVVAFNNCGEGFTMANLSSVSGGSVEFSTAGGESCEEAIVKVYASTFHPFLNQTCGGCHVAGGIGLGVFGSPDVVSSYTAFANVGASKISSQAVNAAHKPPYTGPQNQARITEINAYWGAAQDKYAQCLVDSGQAQVSSKVKSATMTVPANLATTFVTMTFDLASATPSVPLTATIDIRRAIINNVTQGYEFRNPTLRLKNTSSGSYQVKTVNLYINMTKAEEVTTYQNVSAVISTTTATNLSAGTANAIAVMTPNTGDVIALEYETLASTTATSPSATPTATATATATPTSVTYTQLAGTGGVFANNCFSCHSASNARGGLDLTKYASAKTAAANIQARMNNSNNPMPTSGILSEAQRAMVDVWVANGAPQ